jgi:hypothetical protein
LFGNSDKYDVVSAAGTITISDPKLHSREALISERFVIAAFGFDDLTGVRFFVDLNLARFVAGRLGFERADPQPSLIAFSLTLTV